MEPFVIHKPKGATKRKKRLGRGAGSGHGSTVGRGTKGQNARSGGGVRPGFEGGQMPLYRRVARRGFSNAPFKSSYATVKLQALNCFEPGQRVNRQSLVTKGLIKPRKLPVKILGNGTLEKKLTVQVDKLTAGAREKILKAGGQIIEPGRSN